MPLTERELRRYKTAYNELNDDVAEVHKALIDIPDQLELIRGALRIIKDHGAQDVFGLFLLHRHFACEDGQIFVERRYTPNKEHMPVLVTQAELYSKAPRRIAAHRFSLAEDGELQPLEFTTDRVAGTAFREVIINKSLCKDLGNYIAHNNASEILGGGVFVRTGVSRTSPRVFLEETVSRRSVVHILPALPPQVGETIPTLWRYSGNAVGCCAGQCISYCNHFGGLGYCGHRNTGGHMICV
jgi:hypothetical protein